MSGYARRRHLARIADNVTYNGATISQLYVDWQRLYMVFTLENQHCAAISLRDTIHRFLSGFGREVLRLATVNHQDKHGNNSSDDIMTCVGAETDYCNMGF